MTQRTVLGVVLATAYFAAVLVFFKTKQLSGSEAKLLAAIGIIGAAIISLILYSGGA